MRVIAGSLRGSGFILGFISMCSLLLLGALPAPGAPRMRYRPDALEELPGGAPALTDVSAADADHALVVGSGGSVYVTEDGGMTWIPRDAGTSEDLLAVSSAVKDGGPSCGWAAGRRGVVLRTTDGGWRWELLETGTGRDVTDITAVDRDCAWAVTEGSMVLRTTDGGRNWEHLDPGNQNQLRCVAALDRDTALVAGENGTIFLTPDGGRTWHLQDSATADHVIAMAVVVEGEGGKIYALGDAGMLTRADLVFSADGEGSADGEARESGAPGRRTLSRVDLSWSAVDTGVESAPRALCAAEGGVVWVGGRSFLRRSMDGGKSWETLETGIKGEMNSLFSGGRDDLWAVGEEGLAIRSRDGGRTWAPQYVPRGRTLLDVWAAGGDTVWAAGEGGTLLVTTDGGFTWSEASPGTAKDLNAVSASDARNVWAAGREGAVLRSWNGGRSWEEQLSHTAYDLLDLYAVDGKSAWAVGRRGVLLRTFDEGYTWYRLDNGEGSDLTGIWAEDPLNAWAVSREGRVLRIREGGQELEWVETGAPAGLRAISGARSEGAVVLLAVGDEGTLLRSGDGGASWQKMDIGSTLQTEGPLPDLLSVSMPDALHAWICGEGGFLARTSDGGFTWERVETETEEALHGVASPDKDTSWSVGWRGLILHRRASPRLDMVSPPEVEAEGTVTLLGLAFGKRSPGSSVAIGGLKATEYLAWTDSLIRVRVPVEASVREEVRVITSRGVSAPRELVIFPKLKWVSPRRCRPGERVTLSGAAFGRGRGDSFVSLGKARVQEYEYWSNNCIRFRMPGGLPPVVEIRVTTPSGASKPLRLSVSAEPHSVPMPPKTRPRLDILDPPAAAAGSEVRILGSGFGPSRGGSFVSFGGVRAVEYLSWRDDLVVVKVPRGAAGPLQVKVVVSGVESNALSYTVLAGPVIRCLNPPSGPAGSLLEIVGEWFGDHEDAAHFVSFGGISPASYEYWSNGRILVRVPAGLSGNVPVTVTTPVAASDPVLFTVRRPHLLGVSASGNRAFAVGENGTVMVSDDSGRNWRTVETGTNLRLDAVSAADPYTAWAVGEGGVILKTEDGGTTWARHPVGSTVDLKGISAADPYTAWAVGEGGVILKTEDGGATWKRQPSGTGATLNAVSAADPYTAWAVGEGGVILKTEDGGATWTPQNSRLTACLHAVYAVDSHEAWAVGEGGVILKTEDGGAIWTALDPGCRITWRAVCASSSQRAWVAGSCAAMVTGDGGRTWSAAGAGADYRAVCSGGGGALAVGMYGATARFAP